MTASAQSLWLEGVDSARPTDPVNTQDITGTGGSLLSNHSEILWPNGCVPTVYADKMTYTWATFR